jgi:hypothetical protein
MLSGKKTSGSAVAFRLLKIIIFRDKGQAPSDFFVLHFMQLLARLRIFLDQVQLTVPPRGPSHLQPHALLLSSRRTNQNFRLLT